MGVGEYKINLNKGNGEISVKIQESDETDEYIEHLEQRINNRKNRSFY